MEKAKERVDTKRQNRRLIVGRQSCFFFLRSRSKALRLASNFKLDRLYDSSLANPKPSYIQKYISVVNALDSIHEKFDV